MTTLITLLILNITLTAPANERFTIPMPEPEYDRTILNWRNIEREINRLGILEPDKVIRQIRLETGDLTSRYCKECNNLFGMKYPRKRKTTAIGREKSMAVYETWQKSIEDYKLWQDYSYKGGDYWDFLHKVYATDVYYVSKLKRL